jgi:hypothetical protein
MKNLIQAAAVTLLAASAAQAQQAVQWKASDGGNGHWYKFVRNLSIDWKTASTSATSMSGHLATITGSQENAFIFGYLSSISAWGTYGRGPFLGGFQDRSAADYAEPAGGWRWVTGESWSSSNWATYGFGEPNNDSGGAGPEDFLAMDNRTPGNCIWNDVALNGFAGGSTVPEARTAVGYLVEWSADCNGDGIVDYGQCRDGTLPDYNGNNIPDCCERGEACTAGNYPVQWRSQDGGNGHWYSGVDLGHPVFWVEARDMASASGGHLATPSTEGEDHFLVTTFLATVRLYRPDYSCCQGPYIGAFNEGAGWKWVDGTPWTYANWWPGNPNEIPFTVAVYWSRPECKWQDQNDVYPQYKATAYIAEWSADCNNDGVVDKGQILAGQLADLNGNGIPDVCEQPTCRDADLFRNGVINGADLGILLSEWGPAYANTVSDINRDGVVNGADLGFLLANWGPCQN